MKYFFCGSANHVDNKLPKANYETIMIETWNDCIGTSMSGAWLVTRASKLHSNAMLWVRSAQHSREQQGNRGTRHVLHFGGQRVFVSTLTHDASRHAEPSHRAPMYFCTSSCVPCVHVLPWCLSIVARKSTFILGFVHLFFCCSRLRILAWKMAPAGCLPTCRRQLRHKSRALEAEG